LVLVREVRVRGGGMGGGGCEEEEEEEKEEGSCDRPLDFALGAAEWEEDPLLPLTRDVPMETASASSSPSSLLQL